MLRPIYYDTETTGLNLEKDHIIEIAAYDALSNLHFCKFINPGCPIPKEATAISSISDEMVASAEAFAIVGQEFLEFCGEEAILIAHNNDSFDLPILKNNLVRHNLTLPSSWKFIDSLKWARRYRPDLPKHNLQFLRELYKIPQDAAHRALSDTLVLHKVFHLMTDGLPIETIYKLLNKEAAPNLQMPFGKYKGWPLEKVPKDYLRWLAKSEALDKPENQQLLQNLKNLKLI